ncbi:MAG: RNA 2'-phosphotransferase, partial [Succinivibrionaceae bacterium]|nr:RNA 2'-phosphotransferase [Succinivibrionaceae bacterium]
MSSAQQISKEPDTEKEIGKFIALILRHKPQFAGVTLDEHGWADVDELVAGISRRYPFDRTMLENIVAADEKKRYSFNEDHT